MNIVQNIVVKPMYHVYDQLAFILHLLHCLIIKLDVIKNYILSVLLCVLLYNCSLNNTLFENIEYKAVKHFLCFVSVIKAFNLRKVLNFGTL